MKVLISLTGLVIMLVGAWPILKDFSLGFFGEGSVAEILKAAPAEGIGYQAIIVFIGLLCLLYGLKHKNAMAK